MGWKCGQTPFAPVTPTSWSRTRKPPRGACSPTRASLTRWSLCVQRICACAADRACSSPSAPASMERCRLCGSAHVGGRHDPVLPLVVVPAGATGRTQHPPWTGRSGGRTLHTLGQGQATGRDMAGSLGGCCRAWSPCPCPLGGWARTPRRAGAASLGLRWQRTASAPEGLVDIQDSSRTRAPFCCPTCQRTHHRGFGDAPRVADEERGPSHGARLSVVTRR